MKAITVNVAGTDVAVIDMPMPRVRPTYLLVKTAAVAANPADHLVIQYGMAKPGGNLGCDWAGTVVEVGADVERAFKPGDRVCGCAKPTDAERTDTGCFAEYVVVKADIAMHIPDSMTFSDAASLGVATITTGRCLFDTFAITYPSPSANPSSTTTPSGRKILIYGGSTATGVILIQFAKLAGLTVLSTSSPHNDSLVRSYGADVVVDHNSPSSATDLVTTHGPIDWCVDTIGTPPTAEFCSTVLLGGNDQQQQQTDSSQPRQTTPKKIYSVLTPLTPEPLPGDIATARTLGYAFLDEAYELLGQTFARDRAAFERSRDFMAVAEGLLAEGKIRPHRVEVREGGLEGVGEGLRELREGKVSGKKLVWNL